MSESLKVKTLIVILIVGILFTSSNSMPLVNAQPTHTSLTIAVPSPPQGKECTIEATLKDENENPLQHFDIDFYVCGTDCMDWIGTAKTDSKGVASLTYTFPRAGTYNVTAMFSGTTDYVQSSSARAATLLICKFTNSKWSWVPGIILGIIAGELISLIPPARWPWL